MMYEVVVKPSVLRQVRKLELEIQDEIESAIDSLAAEPRPDGCKKLKGEDSLYRIRVARKYRIIYEIKDKKLIVTVVKVGHRREVYR
jgi:mRNA interferase RelE/StbE